MTDWRVGGLFPRYDYRAEALATFTPGFPWTGAAGFTFRRNSMNYIESANTAAALKV